MDGALQVLLAQDHREKMIKTALITASATLHPFSLSQCSSRRTEGSRGDLD
jgi:hypothetical protein